LIVLGDLSPIVNPYIQPLYIVRECSAMNNKMNGFKGWMMATAAGTIAVMLTGGLLAQKANAEVPSRLADGTYLYGESDQPNKPETTYFVFEVKQGQVQGALYSPNSSFDCAYGEFSNNQLSLKVMNTYEKTETPLKVALDRTSLVASVKDAPMLQVGLQGLKSVGSLSDLDRSILATCKVTLSTKNL
jgi:hypothetical protein